MIWKKEIKNNHDFIKIYQMMIKIFVIVLMDTT